MKQNLQKNIYNFIYVCIYIYICKKTKLITNNNHKIRQKNKWQIALHKLLKNIYILII